MPINNQEIMNILTELSQLENLRVNISESLKGGFLTGLSALLGGVVLGPLGLAVGGAVGGVVAASACRNFHPVAEILQKDLTPTQQAVLINRANAVIQDLRIEDAMLVLPLIMQNESAKLMLVNVVKNFMRNDMNMVLM